MDYSMPSTALCSLQDVAHPNADFCLRDTEFCLRGRVCDAAPFQRH